MRMSDFEILRDYRQAKNKVEQVKILADLNSCSRKEMTEFLEARGIKVLKCGTAEETRNSIRYLCGQGMCDEDIAVLIGKKPSSVGYIRSQMGLPKNKKRKSATTDFLKSSV